MKTLKKGLLFIVSALATGMSGAGVYLFSVYYRYGKLTLVENNPTTRAGELIMFILLTIVLLGITVYGLIELFREEQP